MIEKNAFLQPTFGISQLRIRNIGAIDDLSIMLDDVAFLAICAGNGVGKTTILEAISLIGHLPCFPILSRRNLQIEPSYVENEWGQERCGGQYDGRLDLDKFSQGGVEALLADHFGDGKSQGFGAVDFVLFDKSETQNRHFEFTLIVHSPAFSEPGRPRLTELLSRGDPETATPNGCSDFCDDRYLSSCGLIVFDEDRQTGQCIRPLLDQLVAGRTFHHHSATGQHDPAASIPPKSPIAAGRACAISYVNTDLNDFGRGNDLRESPKDLTRNFGSEMVARLQIEFEGANGQDGFKHFSDLQERSGRILREPPLAFSSSFAVPNTFSLQSVSLTNVRSGDLLKAGARFGIQRGHGGQAYEASFLSAGENEVLFVLKMAINLAKNERWGRGILLLDEPDLHIAGYCRKRFFREIVDIGRSNGIQIIMSTHSAAFIDVLKEFDLRVSDSVKVIFRSAEKIVRGEGVDEAVGKEIPIVAKFDPLFLEYMRAQGENEGPFSYIWFLIRKIYSTWKSAIQEVFFHSLSDHQSAVAVSHWFLIVFSLLFPLGIFLALSAAGNDLLTPLGFPDSIATELHPFTGIGSLVSFGAVFLQIAYVWLRLRKIRSDKAALHASLLKELE